MEMTVKGLDPYYQEYTAPSAILRYSKATAGYGIGYLLEHDYKRVYLDAVRTMKTGATNGGLQILEFGCGAGMNLVHLMSVLRREGVQVRRALGTDFSPTLIDAARKDARSYLPKDDQSKVEFYVGKNETLVNDLCTALRQPRKELLREFDLILSVNTVRYCHRSNTQVNCAKDLFDLLKSGGVCVNIDMSDRFLFFRSSFRPGAREKKKKGREAYLPSLQEYAAPFEQVGFEILKKEHFCWIPHSASALMCIGLSAASPVLNVVARSRAMRSLVVVRKPAV